MLMESAPKFATQRVLLSADTMLWTGLLPMAKVLLTSLVQVEISEMESEPKLETKISPPSGLRARWTGVWPTSRRVRTWSVVREGSWRAAQESGAAERLMAMT